MKRTNHKTKKKSSGKNPVFVKLSQIRYPREVKGIVMLSLSALLIIALHTQTAGMIGSLFRDLFMGLFSWFAYILSYFLFGFSVLYLANKNGKNRYVRPFIALSIAFTYGMLIRGLFDRSLISTFEDHHFGDILFMAFSAGQQGDGAGSIPAFFHYWITPLLGIPGTFILWTAIAAIGFFLTIPEAYSIISKKLKQWLRQPVATPNKPEKQNSGKETEDTLLIQEHQTHIPINEPKTTNEKKESSQEEVIVKLSERSKPNAAKIKLPPLELLHASVDQNTRTDRHKVIEKAKMLEEALRSFGVETKVTRVNRGPTITRYELQPSKGVKVSKIVNLSDDIALNLAASSIRIEAPIPGKAAIGIEIPNEETALVTLKELLESRQYQQTEALVPFAMGKNIAGDPMIFDLTKAPHMLIAGATGSGKSVCINTLILSILYKAKPEEVKLLLIDPKVVELNVYNGTPHLLIPVVTDPKKATGALRWAVTEMEERYQKFADAGARDIASFNVKMKDSRLPHIVIIIDELADLMLAAAKEVEDYICRLAQMARAAGIHLIIATQRPSVDVITGIIKANIPTRLAFSVASQVDSRTILDMGGAEKLLGKGDMLFHPVGASKSTRIQGAFVTDDEVKKVVQFLKTQCEPEYEEEVMEQIENQPSEEIHSSTDDLFNDALRLAYEQQQISISTLQRKFKIGYNRAARIIDELEKQGYVGPNEGTKPRKVIQRTLPSSDTQEDS